MRKCLHESVLSAIADRISQTITVHKHYDGGTEHVTRTAFPTERARIRSVALGALQGLNWGDDTRSALGGREQAILDTAEFIMMQFIPCANAYDTLYNPLRAVTEAWRIASEHQTGYASEWATETVWRLFPEWHDFLLSVTAYVDEADLGLYSRPGEAKTTIEDWKKWGLEGLPAEDPGLLWLFWNLYMVSDLKITKEA